LQHPDVDADQGFVPVMGCASHNHLTQLPLGVDRDSEIVAFDFAERDPGMLEMLRLAVTGAKRNGPSAFAARRPPTTLKLPAS
jgi:hypothetical protein